MKTEGLRVLTTIPAAPTTLYLAWLSSEQHAAMTSGTAKIQPEVGSDFSALSGFVTGKLVVLDLGRRIIMSWRTTDFPREAPDSRVEIFFEALGGSTRVTVLHRDIPEGQAAKYKSTWNDQYFTPMRAFFSKFLPDPRDPPPPRRPIPPPDEDEDEDEPAKPMAGKKPTATKPTMAAAPAVATGTTPGEKVAKADRASKIDRPSGRFEKAAAAGSQPRVASPPSDEQATDRPRAKDRSGKPAPPPEPKALPAAAKSGKTKGPVGAPSKTAASSKALPATPSPTKAPPAKAPPAKAPAKPPAKAPPAKAPAKAPAKPPAKPPAKGPAKPPAKEPAKPPPAKKKHK